MSINNSVFVFLLLQTRVNKKWFSLFKIPRFDFKLSKIFSEHFLPKVLLIIITLKPAPPAGVTTPGGLNFSAIFITSPW